ncbi:MAG: family 20 glycosylhydrolase [Clostridia bacterium]|nr:family 20 glycosylhydrolase [Clostridia bacterium]
MNIKFNGLPEALKDGIAVYTAKYADKLPGTLNVNITFSDEKKLKIKRKGNEADITVTENVNIFRALSMLLVNIDNENYSFENDIYFDFNGVMYDFSQANAFLSVKSVKELLTMFAGLGLNKFLLYIEDCLTVDDEPYHGYMRPKYSETELKEIDDYAYSLGIEVIPCVQTLSHLGCLMKWSNYRGISDDDDRTLLVGSERVYLLIERMFKSVMRPLRTKTIHIGLDEAWTLGQGRYLRVNGYKPAIEVFAEHVSKVKEIAEKLGYYPLIWNDMYFRALSNGLYYLPIDKDIELNDKCVPPSGIGYVYWDYYHGDDYVEHNLKKHHKLFEDLYFAGACSTGASLALKRAFSERNNNASLMGCKKDGQRKVFCTVWGDNVREVPPFAVLNGIMPYSEHCYYDTPERSNTEKMFKFITGIDLCDFDAISDIDIIKGYSDEEENYAGYSPSRHMLYQDVMCGFFEKNFEGLDTKTHFAAYTERMNKAYENALKSTGEGMFSDMFKFYRDLGAFLELKGDIGRVMRAYYTENNREKLAELAEKVIPEAIRRGEDFTNAYRKMFFDHYKALGFDVFDIRTGGIIARLKTAKMRIENYLSGKGDLSELDEELLIYDKKEKPGYELYTRVATSGII